ncbi:uncharacterized protein LOC6526506 [Drosophila yakuba]|uniref:MADF domain-containing protein n=1 Tax=Drosophila yakuba TaxID=7245 RepID=B4NW49_DROYA|nr:uncharacterized protein LOC6526506 [Drosophila yakuba]EDW87329.1 uncharacterized protein Dyak_GE15225 [Drosophila yakuba]
MKSDNYRLIAEVSKRRCLWDTNMAMAYRNQDAPLQWASVAQIMQQDVTICKKRFKGMRDSYRAEVRKIQQKRIEMSHWPYFRSLEFMRHLFDPECLVPFPPEPCVMDADQSDVCEATRLVDFAIDVDLDNDDSVDFEIIDDIFQREPSVPQDSGSDKGSLIKPLDSSSSGAQRSDQDLSPTLPTHLPCHQQFLPRPPPPSKRARRRKTSPSNDGTILNGYASQATKFPTEADLKNDSDLSFMLSMMPHVKCLSAISNLKFRMEMARVLVELREEDQQMLTGAGPGAVPERGLPKLTPAPNSSFASQLEKNHYHLSNSSYQNSSPKSPSSLDYVDSSMIECDVKIENEPLL